MNKFLKSSLLAAAVAATGAANAGTFNVRHAVYSAEGIELVSAAEQKAPSDVIYKLGSDYEAGATLTFTFTDDAIADSTVFPESVLTIDIGPDGKPSEDDVLDNVATFTKSTTTANSVTYMLTAKASGTKTLANSVFVLKAATDERDGLALNTAAIKAGPVTVTASAEYQGVAFDPDTTTKGDGNEKKNQLIVTSTQFGKYVLVDERFSAKGKIALTAEGKLSKVLDSLIGGILGDIIGFRYSDPVPMPKFAVIGATDPDDAGNDLSASKLTTAYELVGQLPGFETSQIHDAAGDDTIAVTANGFKVTLAERAEPQPIQLIIETDAAKNDALVAQRFSVIPSITYNSKVKTFDALAAGGWTVNAETVNIPYMPYGATVSQIIYATNSSAVDAQVSATAIDENGQSYALGVTGTAKGNGAVTKLSGGVNAALAAQGFTKGKVSIDLFFAGVAAVDATAVKGDVDRIEMDGTVVYKTIADSATLTLPKGAIKVQSAYNVNGSDRGFVANSTNGSNGCEHCNNDLPDVPVG